MNKINNREDKGQVALILVLITTVVSALAVSLASRSTVDTKIQQTEAEGVQALLFAQSGLEQLILNPNESAVQDTNYSATKSDSGIDSLETGLMETGSSVELTLGTVNSLSSFSVYWGPDDGNPSGKPAIFISLIEKTGKISDKAFDYDNLNNFTAGKVVSGVYPRWTDTIGLNSNVSKIRITVLGSSALLKVIPAEGEAFPSQLKSIKSIGSVSSDNNIVKYGLQYDESTFDTVPSVFDYALFSGGQIVQ